MNWQLSSQAIQLEKWSSMAGMKVQIRSPEAMAVVDEERGHGSHDRSRYR